MPLRLDDPALKPVASVASIHRLTATGDPRQEAFDRSLRDMLGQTIKGEVLARFKGGDFLVRIAGTPARMSLPGGAQVGSDVALTLVSVDPRPAFEIGGTATRLYPNAAVQHPALRPAAQLAAALAPLPGAEPDALPTGQDGSSMTHLSATARVLDTVLGLARNAPPMPMAVIARSPLAGSPLAAPEQMAAALRDAIGASGLFYESHVAEWAAGKRPLPELLREPQMQKAMAPESGQRQLAPGIDGAAAQMINLQLATHEQARVMWQGEAWPGQPMEWDIRKEEDGKHGAGADQSHAWRSGVRFRFPLLGEVAGSVILEGGRLHIQLRAETEASGALLRNHAAALAAALEAAGTPLSSLDIHAHAPSSDG